MNGFAEPAWLLAIWALAPFAVLLALGIVARRRAPRRFVDASLLPRVAPARRGWPLVAAAGLFLLGGLGLLLALARPLGEAQPREAQRLGRDVCVVVDVSRSMLATDLAPTRLERTKLWIRDMLEVLRGDRVALVAFAGRAEVKSPLTHDTGYVRLALEELSPLSVARGGTNVGDAIRLALDEVFDLEEARYRDILLITDGEDQGSLPVEAAAAAGSAGVRLIAIGIGDPDGSPIRINGEVLRDPVGNTVVSRLDAAKLREMVEQTPGGTAYEVGTGDIRLDDVYEALIRSAEQSELAGAEVVTYEEWYQVPLALSLVLLMVEFVIGERASTRP